MLSQDQSAYEVFSKKLIADLKPEGPVEEQYAQTVADCSWRLNSAAAREANLLSLAIHERMEWINSGDEQVDAAFAAAALGEFRNFDPRTVSRRAWLSLIYLAVAGSIDSS